ncbi:MAG: tetratricopeptide repeat protein [Buchnera aphidicola (Kaburagia rhusicola ensigallis)]
MFKRKDIEINYGLNYIQKISIFFLFLVLILIIFYFKKVYSESSIYLDNYESIIQQNNISDPSSIVKFIKFIQNNKNSIDGSLAALQLSKMYVYKNDLNSALLILKKSLKYTPDVNIFNMMILNISRIKFQLFHNTQAIKIINLVSDSSWESFKNDLKGDMFFLLNNKKMAFLSWKKSLDFQSDLELKEIISMKLNRIKNEY